MKHSVMAFFLLFCLMIPVGCSKQANPAEMNADVSVIQTFDIDLHATNMSGYDWFVYEINEEIVTVKNDNFVYLHADGIQRKTDIYRYTLEAIAPGETLVEFRYAKGPNNLENCIGKAVYAVTVDENLTITAEENLFEDPKAYVFVEDIGNVAMENLNLRCITVSLPDNEQDANSWYYTIEKEDTAVIAKEIFKANENRQWGTMDFYIEATKRGRSTVSFYYIPDAAIAGTLEVPTTQAVGENGEIVEVPEATDVLQYACDNATYRAVYVIDTDKELQETIVEKEEHLPDVSVPVALSAETVFAQMGLDTTDPDLKYQSPTT